MIAPQSKAARVRRHVQKGENGVKHIWTGVVVALALSATAALAQESKPPLKTKPQ